MNKSQKVIIFENFKNNDVIHPTNRKLKRKWKQTKGAELDMFFIKLIFFYLGIYYIK